MADHDDATRLLSELWDLIDSQQWDRIFGVLDPAVRISYVHTGEELDAASYVRLNREYPGSWRISVTEIVGDGQRAACRARVSDGQEAYWVASFATTRDGRITELTEVWTEEGQTPPPRPGP